MSDTNRPVTTESAPVTPRVQRCRSTPHDKRHLLRAKGTVWELCQSAHKVQGGYMQKLLDVAGEKVKTQRDVDALVGRVAVYFETRYAVDTLFTEVVYDEDYDAVRLEDPNCYNDNMLL
eukprot:6902005-Pyramimonas_sp.AAC.1